MISVFLYRLLRLSGVTCCLIVHGTMFQTPCLIPEENNVPEVLCFTLKQNNALHLL
jgi:hypothetical protein